MMGKCTSVAGNLCCFYEEEKPVTNAEHIRSMSDEELAEFIATPCVCDVDPTVDAYRECGNESCIKHLINWLKQPKENTDER
jgi:hypothetical protein